MADSKISGLTALTGANLAAGDLVPVVDVSDTTQGASGSTKNMTAQEAAAGFVQQDGLYVPRIIARTADSSNITSNTTLASDSVLTIPILASKMYFVEAWILFFTGNATMDAKFGWSVPASATMAWGFGGAAGASVVGFGVWAVASSGTATLLGAAGSVAVGGGNGITNGTMLAGVVTNSTNAGNLALQIAQNTSDAGNLRLVAGSMLRVTRIS